MRSVTAYTAPVPLCGFVWKEHHNSLNHVFLRSYVPGDFYQEIFFCPLWSYVETFWPDSEILIRSVVIPIHTVWTHSEQIRCSLFRLQKHTVCLVRHPIRCWQAITKAFVFIANRSNGCVSLSKHCPDWRQLNTISNYHEQYCPLTLKQLINLACLEPAVVSIMMLERI